MKKIYLNLIFQISALALIVSFFIFEDLNIEKLKFIFLPKSILILVYMMLLKILIAYFFVIILNLINNKKNDYLEISNSFLQGGVINSLLPGAGLVFKYYKLRAEQEITLVEYSATQSFLSLSSLFSYIFLGILFGAIIIINFDWMLFSLLFFILFLLIYCFKIYRLKMYNYLKKYILRINALHLVYEDLKKFKNTLQESKFKLTLIFLSFNILAILECLSFYMTLQLFGADINFLSSNLIYIGSSLVTVISMMNFIGFFEILITFSASFFVDEYLDFIFLGFGFKILNTVAILLVIIINRLVVKIKKIF